ncbi:hypothetical protein KC19_VG161800 [Ceratodon purpureus]|uniref:BRCT domain-containing protein n=1 Tax=Ceratodon purpureus TaxID=3225 RepID=A0A8T0HQK2_CERPU|nr:hypothetical protein KC19_VG161800 [Ceratodon purpureus]
MLGRKLEELQRSPNSRTIATLTMGRLLLEACCVGANEAVNIFDSATHVIVYRMTDQIIPRKDILQSLGGQSEHDMAVYGQFILPGNAKVKVVYIEWLSDSLQANRVLAEEAYLALP